MPDEGSVSGSISALNIARAADEVARDAVEMAVRGGADLLAITGLSRVETLDAMLCFSASFSEPLVCQLDPKIVHHAKQMLQVTAKYAEHILRGTGNQHARRIAHALVETFPTHGYVIPPEEAGQLGLPVKSFDEYEFAEVLRNIHRIAEDGAHMIDFCELDTFTKPAKASEKSTKAAKPRKGRKGDASNGQATSADNAGHRPNGLAVTSAHRDG